MKKLFFVIAGLLITALPQLVFAQAKTISGKITDSRNNPVPGVSVMIKKTTQATVTDVEGKFSVTVPENTLLIISSIGFKTQMLNTASLGKDIQVKLEEDVARLDEVVVTGLATSVKRRNLANAGGHYFIKRIKRCSTRTNI